MSNKEISLATVRKIANEELKNYIGKKFTEENIRSIMQSQLNKTGTSIIFEELGMKKDNWSNKWEIKNFSKFKDLHRDYNNLINEVGYKVFFEVIKDITPENVLESLTKTDKNILRKAYKETLIKSFEGEIRKLADEHGKQYAQELFEQYMSESEEEK